MVDGMRQLQIAGWDAGEALMSIGVAAGLFAAFMVLALAALRGRLSS